MPLLDLKAAQLEGTKESIYRCRADGPVTLIVHGGEKINIIGAEELLQRNLSIVRFPVADSEIVITWPKLPMRLLVVGEKEWGLHTLVSNEKLQAREKKIVPLAVDKSVDALIQLSAGPDYGQKWARRLIKPASPLAGQIDLSRDEIGPNEKAGIYQRIWIVRYQSGDVLTQRQLETTYQVGENVKDFRSDKFLRRSTLEQPDEMHSGKK